LLNQALQQTGWSGSLLTGQNWRDPVRQRIETIDWERALPDVLPFLEPGTDPDLLTKENLLQVLEMNSGR
jgi:hypothetical protein